jgi:hypothetical protein
MRHRTHGRTRSGLALILTLGAPALSPQPAGAEVIEVAANGTMRVRGGTGAVQWTGVDVAPAPHADGPGSSEVDLPADVPADLGEAADLSPAAWRDALGAAARSAGISPVLLEAVVWQESRWNPRARSRVGALGLGQLMPATARHLGVDPLDPVANLSGAALYLRRQLDRFDGNIELALAAYNAGPERVARLGAIPPITETRAYVSAITARLARTLAGDFQ